VFHLVDSRHKLTKTDQQMIDIMTRSLKARTEAGVRPFNYVVVLTKADKASAKQIASTAQDVRDGVAAVDDSLQVSVLVSSAVDKVGREGLLSTLIADVDKRSSESK
jgi:GTP-binding protein EngB required for normal cell division